MIEIYTDFFTDTETDELISYYKRNLDREYIPKGTTGIYRTNFIDILPNYNEFEFYKKLNFQIPPISMRIQCVNNTIDMNLTPHMHKWSWTMVVFLNDDFEGGELIIDNMIVKPKKNQMLSFSGAVPHYVNNVTNGDRFTLVSFLDIKLKSKQKVL